MIGCKIEFLDSNYKMVQGEILDKYRGSANGYGKESRDIYLLPCRFLSSKTG